MPNILGIVGSPRRRGNTSILVARILAGAQEAGAETQTLFLGPLTIRECDGCHACWKGRECSKQDDMNAVYPKIAAADAIVFGTPVYWYGPTALMKAFIDRFVYFNCPENRPQARGKRAAIAVPLEEDEAGADLVVSFFEKSSAYLEMDLAGKIIAPGCGEAGEVLSKPEVLDEAYELGRRLAEQPSAP